MELFWLVPVVFGVVVLVVFGIILGVLVPAAKRQVDADFERRRRDEQAED